MFNNQTKESFLLSSTIERLRATKPQNEPEKPAILYAIKTRARARGGRNAEDLLTRFLRNILIPDNGCWIWTKAQKGPKHRCSFWNRQKIVPAHNWAYERLGPGKVPDGYILTPTCGNHACVNPDHMKLEKRWEKWLKARAAGSARAQRAKTQCPHGHPYDEANTYFYRNRSGNISRNCKTCMKARDKARWQAKKSQKASAI